MKAIFTTVKNIKIQNHKEIPHNIVAEIPFKRQQWLSYLTENDFQIKQERAINKALYAWLYRNDKSWLVAEHQKYQNKHINTEVKYDWAQRDRDFVKELIQIKNVIIKDIDGMRRSRNF